METTISIIIPVYNVEEYLEQCLDSIVNQSVSFDEVILINDGSTDKSLSICEAYASSCGYFKLLSQKNMGPSAARNIGIENATGNYIMFLDADDYLRPDSVRILKEYLQKIPYDAIYFDANVISEDNCDYLFNRNEYDRKDMQIDDIKMTGLEYFGRCYPQNYVVSACMAIYNRELIEKEKIRFPEGMFYEDNFFTFVFTIKAECVGHISQKLYQRRYRKNSTMTSKYSKSKFKDHVKIGALLWDQIIENQNSLIPNYRRLFLNFTNDYFRLILDKFQLCRNYKENTDAELTVYLESITEKYLTMIDKLYLEDAMQDIPMLNKLLYNLHHISLEKLNIDETRIKKFIVKIVEEQKIIYSDILRKLPLDRAMQTVGIYGTGNHTEGLLAIFEKIVGNIKCDLVFLDSCPDKGMYRGKRIINYKEIDKDFDLIIISSFLYEQEMADNVRKVSSKIPIYRFYETLKKDIFSEYRLFLKYC